MKRKITQYLQNKFLLNLAQMEENLNIICFLLNSGQLKWTNYEIYVNKLRLLLY